MTRIAFDYRMGGTRNAGLGRYAQSLLRELIRLSPEVEWLVLARMDQLESDEKRFFEGKKNVKLIDAPFRHYSFGEQIGFFRLLNKLKPDLVHFPNFNVPILYKRPYIVTIHDVVHHRFGGHKKSRLIYFWGYKKVISSAARNSKCVITVSEAAKKEVVSFLQIPEDKVRVIYEGRSLEQVEEGSVERVKRAFNLPRQYFLFVGTLERKKNVPFLTIAFSKFLEVTKLDIDLVICGKIDPHYPEIKDEALRVSGASRIVFTGFVSDEELSALYQGSYAFVNASVNEGFGLPGVEAMGFGVPLIVANTPTFNEIYDDAAVYFEADKIDDFVDKMRLLAGDQKFHHQMQLKSARRSTNFSWKKTAIETQSVYQRIINNLE